MATSEAILNAAFARRKSAAESAVITATVFHDQERDGLVSALQRSTAGLRDLFATVRGIPPSSTVAACLQGCREFRRVLEAMLVKARKPRDVVRKPNAPRHAAAAIRQESFKSNLNRPDIFVQIVRSRDRFHRALGFMTGFPCYSNLIEGIDACREFENVFKKIDKGPKIRSLRENRTRNGNAVGWSTSIVLRISQLAEERRLSPTTCSKREHMFDRITSDSAILGGKPIIRGTRISVAMILEWIASGADRDTILRKHPQLTADDVEQATSYASSTMQNEVLLTTEVGA